MPRWKIPSCDGLMCEWWTWWRGGNGSIEENETKVNDEDRYYT